MPRTVGRSRRLELLLVQLVLLATACRTDKLATTSRSHPDNVTAQRIKPLVKKEGMFRVTERELVQAGLKLPEMSISSLRLSKGGEAIPFLIIDNALVFYGQVPDSRYTIIQPYLLDVGKPGKEMAQTAVPDVKTPLIEEIDQTLHIEENLLYAAEARQEDRDDVWFWYELGQQDNTRPDIFDISDPTAPERLVDWDFEDNPVSLPTRERMITTSVGPEGYHKPTFDSFRESDWHDAARQADLIIITTDELAPALDPLRQAREKQGLSVALVPLAEIYDEFGHGSATPQSIQQFITYGDKDDIFNLETVSNLATENLPIVVQLTCLSGLFSHPQETSLSEAMLTHPKGPVFTIAATGLTLSSHQEPFAVELLLQMQDSNIVRIGDAFQEAKQSLEIEYADGLREISDTFALFSDPSTIMVRSYRFVDTWREAT